MDVAYGAPWCLQLAAGTFDRGATPLKGGSTQYCGGQTPCPPTMSIQNADSITFVAVGAWFSDRVGWQIPIPSGPAPPSVSRRDLDIQSTDHASKYTAIQNEDNLTDLVS